MNQVTEQGMKALGIAKVARFAGCIYINYLYHMNNGGHGYSTKAIEKMEASEDARVRSDFDGYIASVLKAIEMPGDDPTTAFFKKAYQEWYGTPTTTA